MRIKTGNTSLCKANIMIQYKSDTKTIQYKNIYVLIVMCHIIVFCYASDSPNIAAISNLINIEASGDENAFSGSLFKDEKLSLSDVNNGSASSAILYDAGYFMALFTNGGGGIRQKVSGKRIPIREIVLQPDGEARGGEPPRTSGRQLVDITEKTKDRKLSTVPVKNGSMQRDREDKIKVQIENKTNFESIIVTKSADIKRVTTTTTSQMGVEPKDKFTDSPIKQTPNISADKAHFLPPMALISDDCNEMKINSLKNISNQNEKDMEFSENEKISSVKVSNIPTNNIRVPLVRSSASISHVHSYDKSRRAIQDYKVKFYTPKGKSEININKGEFHAKDGEYKTPFETEMKSKVESDSSLLVRFDGDDSMLLYPNENNSKSQTKSKHDSHRDISSDYLKKKTHNINNDQINHAILESNFKTSQPAGIEGDDDIMSVRGLNMTFKKNKDEKWSAWHERERDRDRDTMIRFSVDLSREKYVTPTLHLSEGTFLFRFLSGFFTFLHPFNFPTELLRDVMWNTISVPQLILQSVRVEVGFIIAIILALIIALVVPAYGLCCAILKMIGGISKQDRDTCSSPPPGMMNDNGGPCEKRICLFIMQILVLLSLFGVTIMVIGNESACSGASLVGDLLSAAMRDIPTYTQAAHQSMSHVLLHGADQTISALEHDLNRVDMLLGAPIQSALSAETGVDVALDALTDIATVSNGLSEKVLALGACGSRAAALAATARERLRDLKRQADSAKKHCGPRDRPLCETSDTNGIELVMHFELVSEDQMESLAMVLNAKNLTEATDNARQEFNDIPKAIANQTSQIIEEVKNSLYSQRLLLQVSERSLKKAALHITTEITRAGRHAENIVRSIDAVEFWRWIIFLVAILLTSLVILIHITAISCGCCGGENYAGALSKTSVVMMCLFSIPLWLLAIVVFTAGGHGDVFMCRPLYDDPHYSVLGKLLDKPGLLYNDGSGFFQELFEDLSNITINVPVADVLRECKHNRPTYPVFRIQEILDMNVATAHYNWSALHNVTDKLSDLAPAPATQLSVPKAYEELKIIMRAANIVNFTEYRLQMNGPLTGKDLNALADQFESIANQISDLTTSSRIETLASRTRRLSVNTIQPLEQLRTEIVFRLTELELQLQPFHKQMNQSLSHLKTIQYYIDNQGAIIAQKKVQKYVGRLIDYLNQYRGHVLNQMENHVAPCAPLWDIYDAGRSLVCRHYIDSLNGFWFGLTSCLLVWTIAAPISLRLRRACKAVRDRKEGLLLRTISHQSSSENAAISDQSAWATPGDQESNNW